MTQKHALIWVKNAGKVDVLRQIGVISDNKGKQMKYMFDLKDREDLNRITKFLEHWCSIMEIQNKDSEESVKGGAGIHYEIEIKLKEIWI